MQKRNVSSRKLILECSKLISKKVTVDVVKKPHNKVSEGIEIKELFIFKK